jgi:hypothetical protein
MLLFLLLLLVMLPAASMSREASRGVQCRNNLRQLALALCDYHDRHGHFPPLYVADANGRPMHSWRVLILPHLGEDALFKAYDRNERWDGANNSKLASRMPAVYRCPADPLMPPGMTSYFGITGPGRRTAGKPPLSLDDIADGRSNTIALVESSSARVNWLAPRDLTMGDIVAGENTAEAPCPCSRHGWSDRGILRSPADGFHAAMFDATVHPFAANLDVETLRALVTIDGSDRIDLDAIPSSSGDSYIWPGFWVLLAAEIAFVAAAIARHLRIAARTRREVTDG